MTSDTHASDRIALFPAFKLDMSKSVYERGDIRVYMTWNFDTGRPCIVMTPNVRRIAPGRVIPCVITLDTMWKWMEGSPGRFDAYETARTFAPALGLPDTANSIMRILGLVRDYLEELTHMPPVPSYGSITRADAIITDPETGRETHKEIIDHG